MSQLPPTFATEVATPGAANEPGTSLSPSYDPGDKFADLAQIKTGNVTINLKYAGTDNFMRQNMYRGVGLDKAFINKECLPQIQAAAERLKAARPSLKLVIYDSTRPLSAQMIMWNATKNKMGEVEAKKYVAPPNFEDAQKVSMHNLGLAIDVGLETAGHEPVDMGTNFDDFSARSHIDAESESGLTAAQKRNREALRDAMTGGKAGFKTYQNEWWHFSCFDRKNANDRARFPVVK